MQLEQQETFTIHGPQLEVLGEVESKLPAPAKKRSMASVVLVALILFYLPAQTIQMTAILTMTDSIEYGQLKTGQRNEAVTLSVRPMLDKIAGAFSNGIVGFVAVAAGMVGSASAADMTSANIHTFTTWAYIVPSAGIVLSLIVFLLTVRIDEKRHAQIVRELETQLADSANTER